jgi:hypothetical protein
MGIRLQQHIRWNQKVLRDENATLSSRIGCEHNTDADVGELRIKQVHAMTRATQEGLLCLAHVEPDSDILVISAMKASFSGM